MRRQNKSHYCGQLKAVVLDWAGTTVDYGCFGPVVAFQEVFRSRFIEPSEEEVRTHMGIDKIKHIKAISAIPRIRKLWAAIFGREPDELDFQEMHQNFEEIRLNSLHKHSPLVPGLLESVSSLRGMGLSIGSTTGYTSHGAKLMQIEAGRRGYWPDCVVCASDVPAGRPHPWMCFRNAMELGTYPMSAMAKVGDTILDVQEGINAGMWTVALTTSGNEMGLTPDQVAHMDPEELRRRQRSAHSRMKAEGAHFIIEDIRGLPAVIEEINQLLAEGFHPDDYRHLSTARSETESARAMEVNACSP